MARLHSDTIVAPITGSGPAAVAVIRLSGPESFSIAGKIFSPWANPVEPKRAIVGQYKFGEQGIALPFAHGHSFTGDEVVELSVHGGRASVKALIAECTAAGARLALPGEFTLRAFLNGQIDLSQAEAIADLVEAQTARELRLAGLNLRGGLRAAVNSLREDLIAHLALIEATIDFSEEIGEYDYAAAKLTLTALANRTETILEQGRLAHLSRRGVRIAILGQPNAGKSSLLNAILGVDRAIVTPIAGTTRDTLEESVDWKGQRIVLTDTAGLRSETDLVETLGVQRSYEAAKLADEIFYLFDASIGWAAEDDEALEEIGRPVTIIGAKCDLAIPNRGIPISSAKGLGISELLDTAISRFSDIENFLPTNERESDHLTLTLNALNSANQALIALAPIDLLAVLLKDAIDHLGRVTGVGVSEDMLHQIFSRFCIGK